MTTALPLLPEPVPVSEVRAPGDRFRCEPYRTLVFARACAAKRRHQLDQLPRASTELVDRQALVVGR